MSGRKLMHVPDRGLYVHWCPGCKSRHEIAVDKPFATGARWTFDGDMNAPSFAPSVHIKGGDRTICHYFLRGGMLDFLGDSDHELAARMVPLPDLPEWVQS